MDKSIQKKKQLLQLPVDENHYFKVFGSLKEMHEAIKRRTSVMV